MFVKFDSVAGIAKASNGEEGTMLKGRNNVGAARFKSKCG